MKNTLVKHLVLERKRDPEFRMDPSRKKRKKGELSFILCAPRGSKTSPQMDTKIWKNRSWTCFFEARKTAYFHKPFFLNCTVSGGARTSKIQPKRCTVVQNRGCQVFRKKIPRSWKRPPRGPPTGDPKTEIPPKSPTEEQLKNNPTKKPKNTLK